MRIDSENGTLAVTRAIRGNSREKIVSRARLTSFFNCNNSTGNYHSVHWGINSPQNSPLNLQIVQVPLFKQSPLDIAVFCNHPP